MKTLSALLLSAFFITVAKAQNDEFQVKLHPITPDIETRAAKALEGCAPVPGKIVGEVNKNNIYTLTGDLFHNGRISSVIDDDADVIICEWHALDWKPISVINVETDWSFPSNYRDKESEHAKNQPKPFWMLNLTDRSCLAIASNVRRMGQFFCVILFNSDCTQILDWDYSYSILCPEVKDHYLVTGDISSGRFEFEGWYFAKIQRDKFVKLKSWELHSTSYRDPDAPNTYSAYSDGKEYSIDPDTSGDKNPADYVITEDKSVKIYLTAKENPSSDDDVVYIFEKLTGLPRELYPPDDQSEADLLNTPKKPETKWEVKVTGGDPALIKLLSTK